MKNYIDETCPRCSGFVWHRQEACNCNGCANVDSETPGLLEAIGKRIRACRESRRLSLDELAERIGMSKTGLWQIEAGKSEPMARTVMKLSLFFGVTTDYLLFLGK